MEFYAWYAFDFRADTQHLTLDERHAYRDLCDEIFVAHQDACTLPDDDVYLARIVSRTVDEWKAMRYALLDGPRPVLGKRRNRIHSERLTKEIRKAQKIVAAQSGGGRGGRQKQLQGDPEVTPNTPRQKESKKKPLRVSKKEKGSTTVDPQRGTAIEDALKKLGLDVSRKKTWPHAKDRWLERATEPEILAAIEANSDAISTADKPLQYTNAIVRHIAERRAPTSEPEPARELTPEDQKFYAAAGMSHDVYDFILANGDPDESDLTRAKFDKAFAGRITEDQDGEDRWSKWLRVCREVGVLAKPASRRQSA